MNVPISLAPRMQAPRSTCKVIISHATFATPSIPEIIWVKNVRAIVVCGFLMKFLRKTYPENLKKIVGAVWELPDFFQIFRRFFLLFH